MSVAGLNGTHLLVCVITRQNSERRRKHGNGGPVIDYLLVTGSSYRIPQMFHKSQSMKIKIKPITEEHTLSFREAVGTVARERKYLIFVDTPTLEQSIAFVKNNVEKGYSQFVAVDLSETVVGWCDISVTWSFTPCLYLRSFTPPQLRAICLTSGVKLHFTDTQ